MRISDWSSDVCSSDLTLTGQTEQNAYHLRELEKAFTAYKAEMDKRFADPAAVDPAAADPTATPASLAPVVKAPTTAAAAPAKKPEIGRASCRERVCQYV